MFILKMNNFISTTT